MHAASNKEGYDICILDFKSSFDLLGITYVVKALTAKGMLPNFVSRLRRYYTDSSIVPFSNNIQGGRMFNRRLKLRQGDYPSSVRFGYGVDPLILYHEKGLKGILIQSTPLLCPPNLGETKRTNMI